MSGWRGLFSGFLALVALEVVVSTKGAADRTATGFSALANVIARALSPAVPLVPDRGQQAAAATAPSSSTGGVSIRPADYPSTRPQPAPAPVAPTHIVSA